MSMLTNSRSRRLSFEIMEARIVLDHKLGHGPPGGGNNGGDPPYSLVELGTLPGYSGSGAIDVNQTGGVVGESWIDGDDNSARAFVIIPQSGRTKFYVPSGNNRAFLYDGQMREIIELVADTAGFQQLEWSYGINDDAVIVGMGEAGGQLRGFVAVPQASSAAGQVTSPLPSAGIVRVGSQLAGLEHDAAFAAFDNETVMATGWDVAEEPPRVHSPTVAGRSKTMWRESSDCVLDSVRRDLSITSAVLQQHFALLLGKDKSC